MFGWGRKEKKSDFVIEDDGDEADGGTSEFIAKLQTNLSRLIAYAESADVTLQREVAEKLANEAVRPARQVQIVEYGGLKLLIPLTRSTDQEVQRLAAHALANLSVNAENQRLMAQEGAIVALIELLDSNVDLIQRQSAKALANLGVNADNKRLIARLGGIPKLIRLCMFTHVSVKIEAVAAIANLAVNDDNELEIVQLGGLEPIVSATIESADRLSSAKGVDDVDYYEELASQCARSLRNLSVNSRNQSKLLQLGVLPALQSLARSSNDRISHQAKRALKNLDGATSSRK